MNAIQIDNLSKTFKGAIGRKSFQALHDLSLAVEPGEVFGFLGLNGAGKSTTIKMLLNLIYPDRGSIRILGQDVGTIELRKKIGYLPESPYFYDYLTAEEIVWFAAKASGLNQDQIASQAGELFKRLNLENARKRALRTYSKGMLQRVGLALALVHAPDVVILDEPMSGLDPLGRKMVGDIILELKARGRTVFFSSHILTDVERFCDRIGILVDGRLTLSGRLDEVLSNGATLEQVFLREIAKAGGGIEI